MNAMDSIFLPRFTIGENAFDAFHDEMGRYGKKVAVIHGERAWKAAREYVVPALEKAGLTITTEWLYGHDATHENADKISNDPAVQEADMLLAVGGGKCIDTAKLAADHLGKPVFTAPSIASNCAPVTQISIMYHEDGSFCDIPRLKEVPVHCFINPKLVLAAPVKYLWAGIGDAMAKHVESSWSAKAGRNSEELENTILNIVVSPGVVSVSVHPDYNGGIAHALFYGLTNLELEKDDKLEDVLEATMANQEMTHTPYPVTKEMIYQAIQDLEDYKG